MTRRTQDVPEFERSVAEAGDASTVALAERVDARRIATRDVRHFAALRLRDGTAFELVVHPTDPDVS